MSTGKRIKLDAYLIAYTKIKMNQGLNLRVKI